MFQRIGLARFFVKTKNRARKFSLWMTHKIENQNF